MCYPCLRTGVTLVSGPNNKEGLGEVHCLSKNPPRSPLGKGEERMPTFLETALERFMQDVARRRLEATARLRSRLG